MKYTTKAIEEAVRGGYEPFKTVKMEELSVEIVGDMVCGNIKDIGESKARGICSKNKYQVFLDPDFWRCLGRVRDWNSSGEETLSFKTAVGRITLSAFRDKPYYIYYQYHFIDHLNKPDHNTPEEFFEELLK